MRYEYSNDIDALRIYVQEGEFDDTIEVAPNLFIDFDENKNVLSIEMLHASRILDEMRNRPLANRRVKA